VCVCVCVCWTIYNKPRSVSIGCPVHQTISNGAAPPLQATPPRRASTLSSSETRLGALSRRSALQCTCWWCRVEESPPGVALKGERGQRDALGSPVKKESRGVSYREEKMSKNVRIQVATRAKGMERWILREIKFFSVTSSRSSTHVQQTEGDMCQRCSWDISPPHGRTRSVISGGVGADTDWKRPQRSASPMLHSLKKGRPSS